MAKRKGTLSTVVDLMSEEAQAEIRERAGVLSPLPLGTILPDPLQPRQLLPDDLAQQVQSGELVPVAALELWRARARSRAADPALKHDWQELERLANSIAQHGLINPISVRRVPASAGLPDGVKYLVITGERRYWAHTLLAADEREIQEGLETRPARTIKATIAPEGISIRAHQIVENVMREDIDAIEKAEGFMALRYELSGVEYDPTAPEEGRNHGSALVAWTQVDRALNISDRYRRYVTAVLKLDPRAREIIKRHRLTERAIRPVSQKLGQQPELQVEALRRMVAWQEGDFGEEQATTRAVESLVEGLLVREERREARAEAKSVQTSEQVQQAAQLLHKVAAVNLYLDRLGEDGRLRLAQELRNKKSYAGTFEEMRRLRGALAEILDAPGISD